MIKTARYPINLSFLILSFVNKSAPRTYKARATMQKYAQITPKIVGLT